ncbi:MAG: PKD domain-containing protein, partial [Methanoregula sp.]
FTDTSTNSPTVWNWNFGDGSTATDRHPVHTYAVAGTYTVSLNATNTGGSNTMTKSGYISVSWKPASFILPNASLFQNTRTQLPIRIANVTNGTGIQFNITYNPSVIQVEEITLNQSYAPGSGLTVNATPGSIYVSLTQTDGINIDSPVPMFFINMSGTAAVGSSTPLIADHVRWSDGTFHIQPFTVVNSTVRIDRIRGDFNENGYIDIGDTSWTAYMVVQKVPIDMAADFNNNWRIEIGDAAKIACYLVQKIDEL